jgi:putative addiction module CopG family antidote
MNIAVIEPELEAFVHDQIATGRFRSPEELLSCAILLLQERDRASSELRAAIAIGIDQADRGDVAPWNADEVRREVERRYQLARSKAAAG